MFKKITMSIYQLIYILKLNFQYIKLRKDKTKELIIFIFVILSILFSIRATAQNNLKRKYSTPINLPSIDLPIVKKSTLADLKKANQKSNNTPCFQIMYFKNLKLERSIRI